jgi:hypothetical protein
MIHVKSSLLFLLLVFGLSANAQTSETTIYTGFNEFRLGKSSGSFGNSIQFIDSFTFKGKKEYRYIHRFPNEFELGNTKFKEVLLTFDSVRILKSIELTGVYTENTYNDHYLKVDIDIQNLNKFLVSSTGRRGRKKGKFNSVVGPGYEWKENNKRIWLYKQTSKAGEKGIFFITLRWEQHD